ncbi:hypothetical protein PT974_06207 [Cladobotryum mycophilum]|uniref:DUF7492 domain-containing protein n=1 Tax=Cladobotryum mycophilum TaxID=491253 RepID=A0ABR0SLU5_9HYPO
MKKPTVQGLGAQAAAVLAFAASVSAHSWIEKAFRIAPNGTMVGNVGYPRGYLPRSSTNPPFQDSVPVWLLPATGQSAYSGDEILNKFPKQDNPQYPMLEASAGDFIALTHLENGHTTIPENQPKKPQNRGTLYFYGTSEPKDQEKLFDVHLVWNRDGTGGDRRGRLLATRNYDDGQCYQPNPGALSHQRATELADEGAVHNDELACQSDIKLPDNLQAGSIYTIYWYWDWPDLNADHIDFEGTKNGLFPWAGTFMRGERDPHGFTMDAISKNESYASTVDIRITGGADFGAKNFAANQYIDKQNIYSKAIKEQMGSNYQVDVNANGGGSPGSMPAVTTTTTTIAAPQTTAQPANGGAPSPPPVLGTITVTSVVTVQPTTIWKTVTKTGSPESIPTSSSTTTQAPVQQQPSTVVKLVTTHVAAGYSLPQGRPTVTPFADFHESPPKAAKPARRQNWEFGQH